MAQESADDQHDESNQRLTPEVVKMVCLAATGGFLFGYNTSIISGAMVFVRDEFSLNHVWQEVTVSSTIAAAWIFSVVAGRVSDAFGRKKTVIVSSVVYTMGSICMAFAPNKWLLIAGRFVVGAGVGLSSLIIPLYIAETAPSRIRGALVTANNLFITGGQAISALVAVGFAYLPHGWRFMLGFGFLPAAVQFIGFLSLPESPRFLISQNREEEARIVLQKMRGPDACIDVEFAGLREACRGRDREHLQPLHQSGDDETQAPDDENAPDGFWNVLSRVMHDACLRRALAVGCVLQAAQQLTGINTVMYYAATIILMSGVGDKTTAVWLASLTAVVNFLTTFIGFYAVERMGRRLLTLLSLGGVVVSLLILSAGFRAEAWFAPAIAFKSADQRDSACSLFASCKACVDSADCGYCYDAVDPEKGSCLASDAQLPLISSASASCANLTSIAQASHVWAFDSCPTAYSFLVLIGLCVYLLAFGPGMGPMPWTINSEIYPLWARTTCCSITTSLNWFFNLFVSLTFLTLVRFATKEGTFLLYATFGMFGFVFLFCFLPETRGKSLEDTHQLFRKSGRKDPLAEL